jgi:aminoglycoside 3-N-acetyltransferase
VIDAIRRVLPKRLHSHVAPLYREMRRGFAALDRAFDRRTMTPAEFAALLVDLGVSAGAVVMVHSSMEQIARRSPQMTPLRVIRTLQELVGQDGTLLMPTFPFRGRQLDYLKTHNTFHPEKTPSQAGIITETFRRMPGVIRSLHPTHPVAAWGRRAADLVESHHLGTAFGRNSPLFKLQLYGGLVIGLGVALRDSFTILHVPEEIHPEARQHVFEKIPRLVTILQAGAETPYRLFAMRSDLDRNYDRVERILLRDGALRYVRRKGLKCAVTQAARFIERSMDLIDKGLYLLDGWKK